MKRYMSNHKQPNTNSSTATSERLFSYMRSISPNLLRCLNYADHNKPILLTSILITHRKTINAFTRILCTLQFTSGQFMTFQTRLISLVVKINFALDPPIGRPTKGVG